MRGIFSFGRHIMYPTRWAEDKFYMEDRNIDEEVGYSLTKTSISFFDTFDVVNGVPVFHFNRKCASVSVQTEDSSSRGIKSDSFQRSSFGSNQQESPVQEASVSDEPHITACAFSEDGERFVTCYSSGQFIVWDTNHGDVICENNEQTGSQILAVTFVERSKTDVRMVARNGVYLKWDVEQNNISRGTISDVGMSLENPDKQIELHTVDFCQNGNFVVCTSISDSYPGCQMEVFILNITLFPSFQGVPALSVAIKPGSIVLGVEMSPDGMGIIVGTSDCNMEVGKCILWPLFTNGNEHWELNPGTLGTWSSNSELVVTWTVPEGPKTQGNDKTSAFLWNVKELRENIKSIDFSFDPIALQSPFEEKVLWCRLVSDSEGNDRLIMAIIGTTTRFLFWDVKSRNHTHTIETGILARDMMLASTQSWIDSRVNKMSVRGLNPMAVTADRSKFGAVLGCPCQVFVYDALLGVQLLKLDSQTFELGDLGNEVEIMFSSKNGRIAAIGAHSVMMFAPATSTCSSLQESTMETSMIELDNGEDQSSHSLYCKLVFSGDGDTLGVLKTGSYELHVHNLATGSATQIDRAKRLGESFVDFCLSMDGMYAVTCSRDMEIIVWICLDERGIVMGKIKYKEDNDKLQVMALGISPNAREIVVCSVSGGLTWFTSSTNNSPQEENYPRSASSSKQRESYSIPVKESSNPTADDVNEPLLGQLKTAGSTGETIQEYPFVYTKSHECGEAEVSCCRISADCATAVRLLQNGELEVWNLRNKSMERKVQFDFPRISRIGSQDLLPLSGHAPSLETTESRVQGTGYFLIDQGTTVLPEKDGFLVTEGVNPSIVSSLSEAKPEWFTVQDKTYEDLGSLYVINLNSPKHSRRLRGSQLKPKEGLAISADGRHVACLAGKYSSKIIVWNIYASEDLLPEYQSLSLLYEVKENSVVKKDIERLLASCGANFFNFRHPSGLTVLMEAALCLKRPLLEIILEYALKNQIKVSFLTQEYNRIQNPLSRYHNLVDACVHKSSPETVKIIMYYLVNQVTHETEFNLILTQSLANVHCSHYPIFENLFHRSFLFIRVCEVEAPAKRFRFSHDRFLTATSPYFNLTENEMKELWNEKLTRYQRRDSITLTATAISLRIKDACQTGEDGLVRDLLLKEADYSIFGSFALRAIISYKTYARTLVVQELLNHFLITVVFTIYCFLLRYEGTFQSFKNCEDSGNTIILNCTSVSEGQQTSPINCTGLYEDDILKLKCSSEINKTFSELDCIEMTCPEFDNSSIKEENSVPVIVTLSICWLLAVPCLIRELHQCVAYTAKHQMLGFVYWLKSGWNWMEVLSLFNIVMVIPLAHFMFAYEGHTTIRLSIVVSVESLLLWSRMLFYARPFRTTGPFVVVIGSLATKIVPLMLLGLTVMFGFTLSFHVLYRHVLVANHRYLFAGAISLHNSFSSFGRTMYTLFQYMFGLNQANIVRHGPGKSASMILFVLYMIAMAIILLNMVIAVLGDSFSSIQNSREARFNEARAKAIDDIESMLSSKKKKFLREENAGYLHVLVPNYDRKRIMRGSTFTETGATEESDDIEGKMNRLLRNLSTEFFEEQQSSQAGFREENSVQMRQHRANPGLGVEQDLEVSSSSEATSR
eukprot:g6297.t1